GGGPADGAGEAQREELSQAAQAGGRAGAWQCVSGPAGDPATAGVGGRPVRAGQRRLPGQRQGAAAGRAGRGDGTGLSRCGPGAVGGDEGSIMASQDNLHRETLRAALRVIQTAGTLEEARIQLARMLNVFDKLEAKGIKGDAAVAEAEKRLMVTRA